MKDFNTRNELKQELHNDRRNIYIDEREVWFAHLGINI